MQRDQKKGVVTYPPKMGYSFWGICNNPQEALEDQEESVPAEMEQTYIADDQPGRFNAQEAPSEMFRIDLHNRAKMLAAVSLKQYNAAVEAITPHLAIRQRPGRGCDDTQKGGGNRHILPVHD